MAEQVHTMTRAGIDSTGAHEWLCAECGRHLSLTFPPNYRKVVLIAGDVWAQHVGGAGGVQLAGMTIPPPLGQVWTETDDERVRQWMQDPAGGPGE